MPGFSKDVVISTQGYSAVFGSFTTFKQVCKNWKSAWEVGPKMCCIQTLYRIYWEKLQKNAYIEYSFMYLRSIKETRDCWWAFDAWSPICKKNFYGTSPVFVFIFCMLYK